MTYEQGDKHLNSTPQVTCVVITRNRDELLMHCVKSLQASTYPSNKLEIIVVDNGSSAKSLTQARLALPNVKFIETGRNMLTSAAANIGMNNGNGEYFFILADDNVVDPNTISTLVSAAQDVGPCILGPKTYFKGDEKRIFSLGGNITFWSGITKSPGAGEIDMGQFQSNRFPDTVHNAMFLDRAAVELTGGFDVDVFPMHNEEADLCLRANKMGVTVEVVVDAIVWHSEYEDAGLFSFGNNDFCIDSPLRAYLTGRNRIALVRRHASKASRLSFYLIALVPAVALYALIIVSTSRTRMNLKAFLAGSLDGILDTIQEFAAEGSHSIKVGKLKTSSSRWDWIYDGQRFLRYQGGTRTYATDDSG